MGAFGAFESFLKKEKRAAGTIDAHLQAVRLFAEYLKEAGASPDIDEVAPDDITQFVEAKTVEGHSPKGLLWSLHNYYRYSGEKALHDHALGLRMKAMEKEKSRRSTPKLSTLAGGSKAAVAALRDRGIINAGDLLKCTAAPGDRAKLAEACEVSQEEIDELAFFADLSRITDIKGKRARLLLDGGFRTVRDVRAWDPQQLLDHLTDVIEATGAAKRPPTLIETEYWVRQANDLPDVVAAD